MAKAETTLILRSAIWNRNTRRSILNKALTESAVELDALLHDNIDNSTPAGRLYSRGTKVPRRSANTNKKPGTKTRVIVSAKVFRASASGQPPARRFSKLYNSLKARRVPGKLQILASVNAPGVEILDDERRLNRPFFRSVIRTYRNGSFVDRVRSGVRDLTK